MKEFQDEGASSSAFRFVLCDKALRARTRNVRIVQLIERKVERERERERNTTRVTRRGRGKQPNPQRNIYALSCQVPTLHKNHWGAAT